ncbi:MAG: glycosyltransferase [Candidatus Coproplasma sp.]
MNYLETVNLVFTIIGSVLGLLCIHHVLLFGIGLFARKKFPVAEKKCKYGIIVSARNEERVIGRLIESVKASDYPSDKIQIFVVAHNCTDGTAEVCREKGAIVFEYNNPEERMKGYALRYAFKRIKEEYGLEAFDGYFIMDADNIVPADYISKMNDAFVANGQEAVITSYRNSKNFNENYMSLMYGMYFLYGNRFEQRDRAVIGSSTRVTGTGYLFSNKQVSDGWNYLTMTEDWEFSADVVTEGNKTVFCDEAMFYDEQPTTVPIMLRQRLRWAKGHMQVFFTRFAKLISSIFNHKKYSKEGKRNRVFSKYDLSVSILPLGFISVVIFLLQIILIAFCPLFKIDVGKAYADFFIQFGKSTASAYVGLCLSEIILFIVERKRIGKLGFGKRMLAFFVFPFYMFLAVILDFIAMFVKNLQWKPIPHRYNREENLKMDVK